MVLSHCLSFRLCIRGPQLEMAPLLHSGYNLTFLYVHSVCIRGPKLEMASTPLHSKYLCVTTLLATAAALRNRVMQTCTTILVKCCLVCNFRPLANVVSQEQVQRGGNLHVLLRARERDSDGFQGGEGSFEKRGQGEGAEQLTEKEEPSLLLVQVQELSRNLRMKNISPGFPGGKRQHQGRIRRGVQGIRQMEGLSGRRSRTRRNDAGGGR